MDLIHPRRRSHVAQLWLGSASGADWLLRRLNDAIMSHEVLWHEPIPRRFRMSSSGDACVRALTLQGLGHSQIHPPRVLRIFATGRAIEREIVDEMADTGILLDAQEECSIKSLPLTGHYDVLLKDPGTGERLLGEIKSIKEERFDELPEASDDPHETLCRLIDAGYRGYIAQWCMYAYSKGGLRGFLLFESKNTQRRLIYWLEVDLELVQTIIKIHTEAWKYVRQSLVAPRTRKPKQNPMCKRCWRRYLCKELPEEVVDYDTVREIDQRCRSGR